jgi:flagellar biosynthesis protein FliR
MIDVMILATVLVLFRVGAFVAFLPPMNGQGMPSTVKIGLSIALTFVLAPRYVPEIALAMNTSVSGAAAWLQLAFLAIRETALGAGLAWLFALCLVPVRIGGAWVAQEMGLTIAGLTSPMDQQASNPVSQMLEALGVMLFFLLDLHHVMFWALGMSFDQRPAGSAWSMPSWDAVLWSVTHAIDDGFLVVGPIGVLLFVISLTVLVTMRTAPQFNFMSYGMTLRLMAGLGGLVVFFPELCGAVERMLANVGMELTG